MKIYLAGLINCGGFTLQRKSDIKQKNNLLDSYFYIKLIKKDNLYSILSNKGVQTNENISSWFVYWYS